MCSPQIVNEAMKLKIAAWNASFRQVSTSPFGPTDEVGMLNLIDGASRDAIMRRADASHVYDLSVDNFVGMPSWTAAGDPSYQIWMTHTPPGENVWNSMKQDDATNDLVAYSGDAVSMYTHCGTHIDALNHFGFRGRIWNNYTIDDNLGSRGWNKCGAEKHPPVVARGIMLDIASMHGLDVLPPSYGIGAKDLENCLKHQKTELRPGDVVLLRTGQMKHWLDAAAFCANTPGLTREGAEYLCKGGAVMIGADNLTLEQVPSTEPGNYLPVHCYLLAEAGVPILEMAQLDELSANAVFEFAFIGACIKLAGATGSPMRPIAMPLRE
ncbi:cyclase family protein [Acidisoma sp. S159]|jgi:kynurenine formamidase|uniref:cyclase family protein n=2 Tax=unclassified Acidisoma TaxID=2634065 RepID=UPI00131B3040|nr:cyclase family protein [Acidisoma sp. S159]